MGVINMFVFGVGGLVAFEVKEMATEPQGFIPIVGGFFVGDKTMERTVWVAGGALLGLLT